MSKTKVIPKIVMSIDDDHQIKADHILGRVFIDLETKRARDMLHLGRSYGSDKLTQEGIDCSSHGARLMGKKSQFIWAVGGFTKGFIYSFNKYEITDEGKHKKVSSIKLRCVDEDINEVANHIFRAIECSFHSDEHINESFVKAWFDAKANKLRFPNPKSQSNYQEIWQENIRLSNAENKFIKRIRHIGLNKWLNPLERAFKANGIEGFINELCGLLEGYRTIGSGFKTLRGFERRLDQIQDGLKKSIQKKGVKQYEYFIRAKKYDKIKEDYEQLIQSSPQLDLDHPIAIKHFSYIKGEFEPWKVKNTTSYNAYELELAWLDLLMELEWLLEDQTKTIANSIDDHEQTTALLASPILSAWKPSEEGLYREVYFHWSKEPVGFIRIENIVLDSTANDFLMKLMAPRGSAYPIHIIRHIQEIIHEDLIFGQLSKRDDIAFDRDPNGFITAVTFKSGYAGMARILADKLGLKKIHLMRIKESLNYLETLKIYNKKEKTNQNLFMTSPPLRGKGVKIKIHSTLNPVSKKHYALCPQLQLPYRDGKAGLMDLKVGMYLESLFVRKSVEYVSRYRANPNDGHIVLTKEDIENISELFEDDDLWRVQGKIKKAIINFIDGKHLTGGIQGDIIKIGLGELNGDVVIKYSRFVRAREIGRVGGKSTQRRRIKKLDGKTKTKKNN